jgi:hypothetical protein
VSITILIIEKLGVGKGELMRRGGMHWETWIGLAAWGMEDWALILVAVAVTKWEKLT